MKTIPYIIHERNKNYNKGKKLAIDSYYGTQQTHLILNIKYILFAIW